MRRFTWFLIVLVCALGGVLGWMILSRFDLVAHESVFLTGTSQSVVSDTVTIASPYTVTSLDPTNYDAINRMVMLNLYEGLARTDRNLELQPGLAVSWGNPDPYTWEFRLRRGVFFQDGTPLTADAVKESFLRAQASTSQVKNLLGDLREITIDGDKIRFTLGTTDPLFVQKAAAVLITKKHPIDLTADFGTGPYSFASWDSAAGMITLARFDQYWSTLPSFSTVVFRTVTDLTERQTLMEDGTISLFAGVSPATVLSVPATLTIRSLPSLEVYYLAFNMRDSADNPFSKKELRQAVQRALDLNGFVSLANGYARAVTQFVSSGIFGYDITITQPSYDLSVAQELVRSLSRFTRPQVTLDVPEDLEQFGLYIAEQLNLIGIDVAVNVLTQDALLQKILAGETDFYFFGWRSELGDASDFLASAVHSFTEDGIFGGYNGGRYSSTTVDARIESALTDFDEASRLSSLQEVMRVIVQDDVIGIPLFESDVLYAVSPTISWEPRIDGYILVSDIIPSSK